jgi:hypothetical protein
MILSRMKRPRRKYQNFNAMSEGLTDELKALCRESQYLHVREIPGRGICAVAYMVFTVGLLYGIDKYGLQGRFCFGSFNEALQALRTWDGIGDPPGNWIKHKGRAGEYSNPQFVRDDQ